jgi:hypothetical protein
MFKPGKEEPARRLWPGSELFLLSALCLLVWAAPFDWLVGGSSYHVTAATLVTFYAMLRVVMLIKPFRAAVVGANDGRFHEVLADNQV